MERQPEDDLQRSLNELESSSALVVVQSQQIVPPSPSANGAIASLWAVVSWFLNLPLVAKIGVIGGGMVLGFAIFQAVLKLIASVIGVTLLLGLAYLAYKFFVSDTGQNQQNQQ